MSSVIHVDYTSYKDRAVSVSRTNEKRFVPVCSFTRTFSVSTIKGLNSFVASCVGISRCYKKVFCSGFLKFHYKRMNCIIDFTESKLRVLFYV